MEFKSIKLQDKTDGDLVSKNRMFQFGIDHLDKTWSSRPKLNYEGVEWIRLGRGMECHFALVKKEGKLAIFFLHHLNGMGGYGGIVLQAPADAFKYDEVVADKKSFGSFGLREDVYDNIGQDEDLFGVRIGRSWGVLKLHDTFFCETKNEPQVQEMVPVRFSSPQEAFAQLGSNPFAPSWDAQRWSIEFQQGSDRNDTRPARAKVFQSTLEICRNNHYVSSHGVEVTGFLKTADACANNVFVENEIGLKRVGQRFATIVSVINDDCLKVAKDLVAQYGNDEVCVLNMASRQNPGGGVLGGAGAQEEYLFRCSDYYRFLYQYARTFDPQALYGIPRHHSHRYPLDRDFGGVFSRGVTVFRSSEAEGYALVDNPWSVNMVAVAGINLRGQHVGARLTENLVAGNLNKIRTILRLSYNNGQTRLVLGALGCGAFGNPPAHIAELFHQVLDEPEFNGIFKEVVFAIIKDHNDLNNTNYKAFRDEFCR